MPNLKNMLSSIFGKETESPLTLQGGVEFNQDINKLPKLAWNGEGKPVYLDENGIELPVNKDPLKQAMNNAYLFGDNVKKWLWEDGRLTDDERETKLNIMTGLITAPVGGEAVLGTKAGLGAIKALTPFVGNKIAQGIVASGASGAIGGGAEGLMRGISSDNENPLETALSDAATGAVSGFALGYGGGKIAQAFARKALKGADSAKIKNYFDDYVDGLYQSDKVGGLDLKAKAMVDMRAARNGEKLGKPLTIFDSANPMHREQFKIIENTNPAPDTYHTWIRSADDIQYPKEIFNENNADLLENPDWKLDDMKKALNNDNVTIYSSYPIETGGFVTPSKMEAQSYSGNGKVYSRNVPINDVAWIDSTQGQYAPPDLANLYDNIVGEPLKYTGNYVYNNGNKYPEISLPLDEYPRVFGETNTYIQQNNLSNINEKIKRYFPFYNIEAVTDEQGLPRIINKWY